MTEEEMNRIESEVDKKFEDFGKRMLHPPAPQMRKLYIDMIAEQISQLGDKPSKGSVIIQMISMITQLIGIKKTLITGKIYIICLMIKHQT